MLRVYTYYQPGELNRDTFYQYMRQVSKLVHEARQKDGVPHNFEVKVPSGSVWSKEPLIRWLHLRSEASAESNFDSSFSLFERRGDTYNQDEETGLYTTGFVPTAKVTTCSYPLA